MPTKYKGQNFALVHLLKLKRALIRWIYKGAIVIVASVAIGVAIPTVIVALAMAVMVILSSDGPLS